MNTALHYYRTECLHPETEAVIDCEVAYSIQDCGVLMKPAENYRAVLDSVVTDDGTNILALLDADTVGILERQAGEFFSDEMATFNSNDHHE